MRQKQAPKGKAEDLLSQGKECLKKDEPGKALAFFEKAAKLAPKDPAPLLHICATRASIGFGAATLNNNEAAAGYLKDAEEALEAALKLNPGIARDPQVRELGASVYSNYGAILATLALGPERINFMQMNEALSLLSTALALDPNDANALSNLEMIRESLSQCTGPDAECAKTYVSLGNAYELLSNMARIVNDPNLATTNVKNAISAYERAKKLDATLSNDPEFCCILSSFYNNLGIAHLTICSSIKSPEITHLKDAFDAFTTAIELNPKNHFACNHIAIICDMLGRHEEAADYRLCARALRAEARASGPQPPGYE